MKIAVDDPKRNGVLGNRVKSFYVIKTKLACQSAKTRAVDRPQNAIDALSHFLIRSENLRCEVLKCKGKISP